MNERPSEGFDYNDWEIKPVNGPTIPGVDPRSNFKRPMGCLEPEGPTEDDLMKIEKEDELPMTELTQEEVDELIKDAKKKTELKEYIDNSIANQKALTWEEIDRILDEVNQINDEE